MRAFLPVALLVLGLFASAAFAEESEYEPPEFTGDDVLLGSDDLPEGWTASEEATPAQEAMAKAAAAQGQSAGIESEDDLIVVGVSLKDAAGAEVALVLVDLEVDPKGVPAGLKADAEKNGWTYRELGTPGRILLASGPEAARKAAVAAQVAHAVDRLVALAMKRLDGPAANARVAKALAESALAIEPKSGGAWAATGMAMANQLGNSGSKDKEEWKAAAAAFEKAFAADAVNPPKEKAAAQAYGEWGLALLSQKDPEATQKARDVLKKAVELEQFVLNTNPHWINRYNLVCAQSLLGEKAEAVKGLEEVLTLFKSAQGEDAAKNFVKNQVDGDEDLAPIRGTPEYEEMLKRVLGGAPPSGA